MCGFLIHWSSESNNQTWSWQDWPSAQTENMSVPHDIVKKVKIRAAHRGSSTKLLNRLTEMLSDEKNPIEKFRLKETIPSMQRKKVSLKTLDNWNYCKWNGQRCWQVRVSKKKSRTASSDSVMAELNNIVMRMEEVMSKSESPPLIVQSSTVPPTQVHSNLVSGIPQQSKVKQDFPNLK